MCRLCYLTIVCMLEGGRYYPAQANSTLGGSQSIVCSASCLEHHFLCVSIFAISCLQTALAFSDSDLIVYHMKKWQFESCCVLTKTNHILSTSRQVATSHSPEFAKTSNGFHPYIICSTSNDENSGMERQQAIATLFQSTPGVNASHYYGVDDDAEDEVTYIINNYVMFL